jgi:pyruvate dehydrogenase E2 component (dihydrolipoamide acetyltransferase)
VPDIGDFDEVAVIEVFVKPGDTIKVEQSLITVESDKASMEIPSSHAGVVQGRQGQGGRQGQPRARWWLLQGQGPPAGAGRRPQQHRLAVAPPAGSRSAGAARRHHGQCAAVPPTNPRPAGSLPHASPTIRRWRANWACRWPR